MCHATVTDTGGPKGWARLNKTLTRHKSVLVAFKQKTSTQKNAQQITNVSIKQILLKLKSIFNENISSNSTNVNDS